MTIRILHDPGVGDWPKGAVVELEDRRARRLILVGYAEAVIEKTKRKGKDADGISGHGGHADHVSSGAGGVH